MLNGADSLRVARCLRFRCQTNSAIVRGPADWKSVEVHNEKTACVRRLAFAVTLALAGCGIAQSYPTRPITFIVPYGAGGPADTMARTLAEAMRPGISARPS